MNEMYTALITNSDVMYSMKEYKECKSCNRNLDHKIHKYVAMSFKNHWSHVIQNLQQYVSDNNQCVQNENCESCSAPLETILVFNEVVIIAIENAYPTDDCFQFEREKITKSIVLNNKKYQFRAAVEHKSAHFIAHIMRNNKLWETYDGIRSAKIQRTPNSFFSVLYFYGELLFSY